MSIQLYLLAFAAPALAGLWTISRFLSPLAGRQSFFSTGHYWTALATYPEVVTERAAPPPLFGLAPHGVCPAKRITPPAVRSYRTISPLPAETGGIFSVALSVESA